MTRYSTFFIVLLLIFFVIFIEKVEKSELFLNLKKVQPNTYAFDDVFRSVQTEAKAVYVFDALTGRVLFAQNDDIPLPLASLSKLMTALVALESVPKNSTITIDIDSINEIGDSGLFLGEKWNLENLTRFTLTSSSNDGAHAIATSIQPFLNSTGNSGHTFIDAMNLRSKTLGLLSMRFFNETGLDVDSSIAGGYGSAKDVTLLMIHLWRDFPELMQSTSYTEQLLTSQSEIHYATNTNRYVGNTPGILLSKTGYTDISGGNLAIAFDSGLGHPIFITVLGSSFNGRFTDAQKLVDLSLRSIRESSFAK